MKPIPSHILGEVKRYDPLLNLRWSREKRKFVLERKTDKRYVPRPILSRKDGYGRVKETIRCPENSERYIHYKNMTIPVAFFENLDRRVMWFLYANDSYKIGIGKKFADELEYREKKAEERQDRRDSERLRYVGAEAYENMKRRAGERISFNG